MIGYMVLWAVSTSWAQHGALATQLAEQLGLCSTQKKQPGHFNLDFPCNQCEITLIPLSPGTPPGQMFLMEVQSPGHCGSGGCTSTVYRKYGESYQEVLNFLGFFEKTLPRQGSSAPDIIFLHLEYPRHDYNQNGSLDHAAVRAQYRWDASQATYVLTDILSVEVGGKKIALAAWRKVLLQEYRLASPWVF